MGWCVTPAGKGVRKVHKKKSWLVLLLAGLALLVLTGCTQPKQVGSRNVPAAAQLVDEMAPDLEVQTNDQKLSSGTAAAATYLVKSRTTPNTSGNEENGVLADKMRSESETEKYNPRSAPTFSGVVRMSRLFIYPGDWSDADVARDISIRLHQMNDELYPDSTHQITFDSYYTYTYTYQVSVYQVYGDRNTAWVIGVGVTQTAKEEHKT